MSMTDVDEPGTGEPLTTCLVGLGTIARTHLGVLTRRDDVRLVAAVDPDGEPLAADLLPEGVALHRDLDGAVAVQPDLVVVTTPTPTHVTIVDELLTRTEALVLCEKPLSFSRDELEGLVSRHGAGVLNRRLRVAHHFAFSPEVVWAAAQAVAHPEWGAPTHIESMFNDEYTALAPGLGRSLVSSWVDSGPNQLSLLTRFTDRLEVVDHLETDAGRRAVTHVRHPGGTAVLTSNWLAAGTSKQTTIHYDEAAVRLRMDHTSMTGHLLVGQSLTEHSAYTGTVDRKTAHYLGVYEALLGNDPAAPDGALGFDVAATITRLLADACTCAPGGSAWTSTTTRGRSAEGGPSIGG